MKKLYAISLFILLTGCSQIQTSSSVESSFPLDESISITSEGASSNEQIENSSSVENVEDSSSFENIEDSSTSENIEDSFSSSEDNVEDIQTKVQSFYHKFEKADFSASGGSLKVNGLSFTYSPFTFLGGAQQGVQIGSKKNPQTTTWELKTSFDEEVIVTSFYVELTNASGGSGIYSYSFGNYTKSSNFSTPQVMKKFGEEDLYEPSNDLTFTLKANSAAMYLYSISFSCITSIDSKLNITNDVYEATPVVPGQNSIPNTNYTQITLEDYYKDIDLTSNKETLLPALRNQISNMTKVSYESAKTMLQYTDEHPTQKGYLYGAYDGDLIPAKWDQGASWNREHVWACAHMKLNGDARPSESTKSHATDLHNLRVACQPSNGKHSDLYYDELTNTNAFYPNIASGLVGYHAYEGDFRGDTARILFYMYVRYEGLNLTSDINNIDDVSMGNLTTLLLWNELDPVDEFETQRNNRIYEYQGNRNPFIDYPSIANVIFA